MRSKLKRAIRKTSTDSTAAKPVTKKIEYVNNSCKEDVTDLYDDSRVRIMIFTKDKVAMQFNGPILKFSFKNPANLEPITKLGPDPLRSDVDINDLGTRIYQRIQNNSTTLIADLLLDQTFVAGIGNKYKSEILFLSRINPFATIKRYSTKINENTITPNSICSQYWIQKRQDYYRKLGARSIIITAIILEDGVTNIGLQEGWKAVLEMQNQNYNRL